MDGEQNETVITLGGYVNLKEFKYVYFFIMLTCYILIICWNFLIVYLIWKQKHMHKPMFTFIASLLLNSVFFSTAIYPKLLIDFLSEEQVITYTACLFQFLTFYSIGGTEFLLLLFMSYDRYVSICKPLHYPTVMTKATVNALLALAWLLPLLHVLIPSGLIAKAKVCNFVLEGIFCNNSIYRLQCVRSTFVSLIGLVVLVDLIILPVLLIVITYVKILMVCFQRKAVRKKAAETCLPHLLVLISLFSLVSFDVITARLEKDFPKIARLVMTIQIILYHPLFNPLIYGFKMKEISSSLKKLLGFAKF